MNAGELKKLLQGVDDSAVLLTSAFDHSYREVRVEVGTALKYGRNQWTEDYGEETTPEKEYGKRCTVLIVG